MDSPTWGDPCIYFYDSIDPVTKDTLLFETLVYSASTFTNSGTSYTITIPRSRRDSGYFIPQNPRLLDDQPGSRTQFGRAAFLIEDEKKG